MCSVFSCLRWGRKKKKTKNSTDSVKSNNRDKLSERKFAKRESVQSTGSESSRRSSTGSIESGRRVSPIFNMNLGVPDNDSSDNSASRFHPHCSKIAGRRRYSSNGMLFPATPRLPSIVEHPDDP